MRLLEEVIPVLPLPMIWNGLCSVPGFDHVVDEVDIFRVIIDDFPNAGLSWVKALS